MIVRKIFIRFCKNIESFVMKSINMQGGFLFCAGWNFPKMGKRDVTFIREMSQSTTLVYNTWYLYLCLVHHRWHTHKNAQGYVLPIANQWRLLRCQGLSPKQQKFISVVKGTIKQSDSTQCARTDLNKRFFPKLMTTTGWKGTP